MHATCRQNHVHMMHLRPTASSHDNLHEQLLLGVKAIEVAGAHKLYSMHTLLSGCPWLSSCMHGCVDAIGHAAKVALHCGRGRSQTNA